MNTTWIEIQPSGSGGRRESNPPTARITEDGTLFMNVSAVELLGNPDLVRILINLADKRVRILTDVDEGRRNWRLSGGVNAPYRVRLRRIVRNHPYLAGEYSIRKIENGIELEKQND